MAFEYKLSISESACEPLILEILCCNIILSYTLDHEMNFDDFNSFGEHRSESKCFDFSDLFIDSSSGLKEASELPDTLNGYLCYDKVIPNNLPCLDDSFE